MPWSVRVIDADGKPLIDHDVVCDFDFVPTGDESFPLLGCIDQYDDTRLTQLQIRRFLREWELVRDMAVGCGKVEQWRDVKEFAMEVDKGPPCRYLLFIGD